MHGCMLILIFFLFIGCEKSIHNKTFALVNGDPIKGYEILKHNQSVKSLEDPNSRSLIHNALENIAEERVILHEARKIGIESEKIYEFFEKYHRQGLISDIELQNMRKQYLKELKDRSKIVFLKEPI